MQWKRHDRFPRELWLPALVLGLALLLLGLLAPVTDTRAVQQGEPGWRNSPALQEIQLAVAPKNLWRLRLKRERALDQGILVTQDDDWVAATLWEGQAQWQVKIRLKGDWTDHLQRGKWSFRVKVRKGGAYRGMSVFSLQTPHARSFLKAWLFHQVLRREGVLTTRYDFVRLSFNGADLGVYALEEHFAKELLEAQHRPEGPVFKFSEEGMWAARISALQDSLFPYMSLPTFQAAQIAPFQYDRLRQKPGMRDRLRFGQSLMYQYKHGLAPARDLFDLEMVARQYALTDLFHGHHSLIWHNRRYYYNGLINRLEPVVYDAFAGGQGGQYLNGPFAGYACNGKTSYGFPEDVLGTLFFADDGFVRAYYGYLHRWTGSGFLDTLEQNYADGLAVREHFLRREFLNYQFPAPYLRERAAEIRTALAEFDPANLELDPGLGNSLCIRNYSYLALEIEGWKDGGGHLHRFPEARLLGAFDKKQARWLEFPADSASSIQVRVAGSPVTSTVEVPVRPRIENEG